MSFDEEDLDPHGECAHEIHALRETVEELLVALKGVIAVADRKTVEFDAAKAAIAKAIAIVSEKTSPVECSGSWSTPGSFAALIEIETTKES